MTLFEVITLCQEAGKVYIYGAGKNAKIIHDYLATRNIKVSGFIVSDISKNPNELCQCPVLGIDKFSDDSDYIILMSIVYGSKIYKEVLEQVIEEKLPNVYCLSVAIIEQMVYETSKVKLALAFDDKGYSVCLDAPVEIKHCIFAMNNAEGESCHWRFRYIGFEDSNVQSISEYFEEMTALEEYEESYGKYYVFNNLNGMECQNVDTTVAVYMAKCHVDRDSSELNPAKWIIPIQVGAALTDKRICEVLDNTGENISEKNFIYSECTAIYWMWKNAPKTDYIGLRHYRRNFAISENDITKLSVNEMDVLVTAPTFVPEGIEEFISSFVPKYDMLFFKEAMADAQPEYVDSMEQFLKGRFFPPCNLFIMKYELFQEYANFVFSVTMQMEKTYESMNLNRQDRYMGFFIECLLGIFLMKHKDNLKIAYSDMEFYQ